MRGRERRRAGRVKRQAYGEKKRRSKTKRKKRETDSSSLLSMKWALNPQPLRGRLAEQKKKKGQERKKDRKKEDFHTERRAKETRGIARGILVIRVTTTWFTASRTPKEMNRK